MAVAVPVTAAALVGSIQGAFAKSDVAIKSKSHGGRCANWACCICGSGNTIEQTITVVVYERHKEDDSKTSKIAGCFKKLCCCCCGKKKKEKEKRFSRVGEFGRGMPVDRATVRTAMSTLKLKNRERLTVDSAERLIGELQRLTALFEQHEQNKVLIEEAKFHLSLMVLHSDGSSEQFTSVEILTSLRDQVEPSYSLSEEEKHLIVGGVKHHIISTEMTSITPKEISALIAEQLHRLSIVDLNSKEEC
ncbi:MAG: hypothetical protein KR126chlam2_00815 [Chlamydiae bacterium]|nr:hypothetical protein [Chlamydiota bacterium]